MPYCLADKCVFSTTNTAKTQTMARQSWLQLAVPACPSWLGLGSWNRLCFTMARFWFWAGWSWMFVYFDHFTSPWIAAAVVSYLRHKYLWQNNGMASWLWQKWRIDRILLHAKSIKLFQTNCNFHWRNILPKTKNEGQSGLSTWKYQFSYDHWSEAMLSLVSTWIGDSRSSVAWVLLLTLKVS